MADDNTNIDENTENNVESAPTAEPLSTDEMRQKLMDLGDVTLKFDALLGTCMMPIEQFLKLGRGAIIELNRGREEFIDISLNGHLIGKGEITVVDDNVGLTVQEIFEPKPEETPEAAENIEETAEEAPAES